jgi:hypothetical protein
MNRRQAILQLKLVRAVIRRARELGGVHPDVRRRAQEIVGQTALEIEPEVNGEWAALLEDTRADVERD